MSHFAQINENNVVIQVIVAEQDFINSGAMGDPRTWIQTSYNTSGGVHHKGGTPLRKNFAGVGYHYIAEIDAFVPPKPYDSWHLNGETGMWQPPVPPPATNPGEICDWDEPTQSWVPHVLPGF
jgi:hypothetical protein